MLSKNPLRKVGGRLDVTFAKEVGQASETLTRAKSCISRPGKMAEEQYRINGNTHVSINLRINSAGVDSLRRVFTKKRDVSTF